MTVLGGNIERSSWLSSYLLSQSLVWAMRKGRIQKYPGVSDLLASLGHTGRRVALGHTLNTQTLMKTDEQERRVLSKFTILCSATFIAILGCTWPAGLGLDTPARRWQVSS